MALKNYRPSATDSTGVAVAQTPSTNATQLQLQVSGTGTANDGLLVQTHALVDVNGNPINQSVDQSLGAKITNASKGSAGVLYSIVASNASTATAYWLQLFDTASALTSGTTVPKVSIPLGVGATNNPLVLKLGSEVWGLVGMPFTTGITWAISTTGAVYTNGATASNHYVTVVYQ